MQKTSLYRHFDVQGRLLYIGISLNAMARLIDHRQSHWYGDIFRVEIEHHKSRPHALYAEALAIMREKPLHNLAKPVPIDPDLVLDEDLPMEPDMPIRVPFVPLPGSSGPRTIVYTVIPEGVGSKKKVERNARKELERIAALVDGFGYVTADIDGERQEFIHVLKMAQIPGTRIITDRPEAFATAADILAKRRVTLVAAEFGQ